LTRKSQDIQAVAALHEQGRFFMASILLNLAWKELQELKWLVASSLAIVLAVPLYELCFQDAEMAWFWVQGVLVIYPVFAGILFGMRIAAGERANQTAAVLAALPVPPFVLGAVKLLMTGAATLIPILALVLFGLVVQPFTSAHFLDRVSLGMGGITSALCTLHMLAVVGVFGTGQPTVIMAGGRGIAVFVVWFLAAFLASFTFDPEVKTTAVRAIWRMGPPFDGFFLPDTPTTRLAQWQTFASALPQVFAVMLALGIAFVVRYTRAVGPIAESGPARWHIAGWAPRLHSPLAALLWKQLREAAPMGLLTLGIAAGVGLISGLLGVFRYDQSFSLRNGAVNAMAMFSMTAYLAGFILALLIGVGTFTSDLERRVNTFWRSRPISPRQWFATKYGVGLATLVLTLGLPALAAYACALTIESFGQVNANPWTEIPWIGLAWFGVYSAAVTTSCLVRQPIHAAILAVGLVVASFTIVNWWDGELFQGAPLKTPLEDAAIWIVAAIACIAVGRWAAVRDVAIGT
jgi:ABC-type transport system involved in multi-copper enzyme maturation permease subunit